MIRFPRTLVQARASEGRIRAGGTDESELRHRGVVRGPIVDLRDLRMLDQITPTPEGGLRIGALVTLAELADRVDVQERWPAIAEAASDSATPQIRRRATLAGSLLQEVRCWYFRHPDFHCLKRGGATCFARRGAHPHHSVLDRSTCIAPHPSTMAGALWAHDARVEVYADETTLRDIPTVLGNGTDPRRTNAIEPREIVTAIVLPPTTAASPRAGSAYLRTIHRARAEWPLVEATARCVIDANGRIEQLTLVVGAIAVRPVLWTASDLGMQGLSASDPATLALLETAVASAVPGTSELPDTRYKAALVGPTARGVVERALASAGVRPVAPPEPSPPPPPAPEPSAESASDPVAPAAQDASEPPTPPEDRPATEPPADDAAENEPEGDPS